MTNKIKSIYVYPIKGLSAQQLESVELKVGQVIPGDREYAFARHGVQFDPDKPVYLKKTNFLALIGDEKLARLTTYFNPQTNTVSVKEHQGQIKLFTLDEENNWEICEFFRKFLEIPKNKSLQLIKATEGSSAHSFSDVPVKSISFINLASIKDLEPKIRQQINPARFRGNIYFMGNKPWLEFEWIDREVRIGGAILYAYKRTMRCAATMVNPLTANRDINIPKVLKENYHHMDMGIYAKVIESGEIKLGDSIDLI